MEGDARQLTRPQLRDGEPDPLGAAERQELRRLRDAMCAAHMAEDAAENDCDEADIDAPPETLAHIQAAFAFASQAHYDLDRLLADSERAERLAARVVELEAALQPFAAIGDLYGLALKELARDPTNVKKASLYPMVWLRDVAKARAVLAKEPTDA